MAEVTERLTYDALFEVLSLVSVSDLGRMAQVSRSTRTAAEDQLVWRNRCRGLEVEWGKAIAKQCGSSPCFHVSDDGSWKSLFRDEHQRLNVMNKFLGSWSEKWCDVNVADSTQIETDGTNFIVTYKKNKFSAKFVKFDGESLAFELEGGDSGWSFEYTVKTVAPNEPLQLTVFRKHDKRSFSGTFHRI